MMQDWPRYLERITDMFSDVQFWDLALIASGTFIGLVAVGFSA